MNKFLMSMGANKISRFQSMPRRNSAIITSQSLREVRELARPNDAVKEMDDLPSTPKYTELDHQFLKRDPTVGLLPVSPCPGATHPY
ncbi:hypothetical protein DYB34_014008 [Aphanomyces astaci]|nr:hypothetical protein DYB34_014008 [Aphanomyces astaci]